MTNYGNLVKAKTKTDTRNFEWDPYSSKHVYTFIGSKSATLEVWKDCDKVQT